MAICFAGLLCNSGFSIVTLPPDNPYAVVVTRNVFGLNPKPAAAPAPSAPLPKITPDGFMSVFGHLQVLFKVSTPGGPGIPPRETSSILAEGQSRDNIQVVHIDDAAGVVTFNNNGDIEEIPLEKSAASGPAISPAPAPIAVQNSIAPVNGGLPNGVVLPGVANGNRSSGRGGVLNNNFNNINNAQPEQAEQAAAEAAATQMAQIELNRITTQEQVDEGTMPPLPPTMLTPSDAHVGNQPLVSPLPVPGQ